MTPCPASFVVDKYTGKCKYQDKNKSINGKYIMVVGIILAVIAFCGSVMCVKVYYFDQPPQLEIVQYLAVAMAQIHTWDKVKSEREQVNIGVGSHPENIKDWIEDIWSAYAKSTRNDGLMRRHEF